MNKQISYVLKGEKVGLAAMSKDYLPELQKWINDINTAILTAQVPPFTIEDEEGFYNSSDKQRQIIFAIHELKTGNFIGTIVIASLDYINGTGEGGGMLSPEVRKKGYGTEALKLMCDYAFSALNLQMIWGRAFSYNLDMYNVAKKIGFKDGGTIRSYKRVGGKTYDLYINSMLSKEFYKLHESYINNIVEKRVTTKLINKK